MMLYLQWNIWWTWSVLCLGTEMIPWILSTKKCDGINVMLILLLPGGGGRTLSQELGVLLLRQFCVQFWLTSKLRLQFDREWRNSYWSVKGISGADILKYLMVVPPDARTLQCVLVVKTWMRVISVCQVLRESRVIDNPELALTDEGPLSLFCWFCAQWTFSF